MTLQEPRRPDPDALLAEAAKAGRGRLKVFLGMAPGVGKTFEMLSQAARRKAEGDDCGIPTAELEHVFEKFRCMGDARDCVKGTGLTIAKVFVEAMGGRIAAASPIHEGRGTALLISLPKDVPTPAQLL